MAKNCKFIQVYWTKYSHTRTSLDIVLLKIWNVTRFLLSFHVDYEPHCISFSWQSHDKVLCFEIES